MNHACAALIVTLLGLALLPAEGRTTPPGKDVEPIRVEVLPAELVIVAVSAEARGLTGVELAWIPARGVQACRSLSLADCGVRMREERSSEAKLPPTRVLTTWIAKGEGYGDLQLAELARMPELAFITADGAHRGETRLSGPLGKAPKVRALVRWELWPNGENFRVEKVLPGSRA